MKERQIPFSAPMVRALLAGRKTQTRRVVTLSNSTALGYTSRDIWNHLLWDRQHLITRDGGLDPFGPAQLPQGYQYLHVPAWNPIDGDPPADSDLMRYRVRPRWMTGDVLLVKESWCVHRRYDRLSPSKLPAAAWRTLHWMVDGPKPATHGRTRPGRFLPNSRVRTRLEVTGVRVERLLDISVADVRAEGIPETYGEFEGWVQSRFPGTLPHEWDNMTALEQWKACWDQIHGFGEHARNPWVWIVEFKVLTPGGAA